MDTSEQDLKESRNLYEDSEVSVKETLVSEQIIESCNVKPLQIEVPESKSEQELPIEIGGTETQSSMDDDEFQNSPKEQLTNIKEPEHCVSENMLGMNDEEENSSNEEQTALISETIYVEKVIDESDNSWDNTKEEAAILAAAWDAVDSSTDQLLADVVLEKVSYES